MTVCFTEAQGFIKDLFGNEKKISNKQAEDLIKKLQKRVKFLMSENPEINFNEALDSVKNQLIDDMKINSLYEQKVAKLNILAKHNRVLQLENFDFRPKGLQAILDGVAENQKGARDSITSLQGATLKRLLGGEKGMMTILRKEGLFERYQSLVNFEDELLLTKAMRGEDVVDKEVARIGEIVRETQERARKIENRWGAGIGDLKDWVAKTSHDPLLMLKTADSMVEHLKILAANVGNSLATREIAFERWFNHEINWVDHNRTFKDIANTNSAKREFMREVYDSLISRVHDNFDIKNADVSTFTRGANFAKRLGASRVLHYKDAESWLLHVRQYGNGSLRKSIEAGIERSAKNIGILKKLGPDAVNNFEQLKRLVASKNKGDPKILSKLNRIDNIWKEIDGTTSSPVSYRFARIAANQRSFIGLSRLGLVTFSSFADVANMASELRINGIGFLDRWSESVANLKNLFKSESQRRETMDLLNTGVESMIGSVNRLSITDGPGGMVTKINQLFYKLNLLRSWDDVHRNGSNAILGRSLAHKRALSFKGLPQELQSTLGLYNIGEAEWNIARAHPLAAADKRLFISADSAGLATDEEIVLAFSEEVSRGTKKTRGAIIKKIRDDMQDKFMQYFHDRSNHVTLTPTAGDRAIFTRGTRPGTPEGEALRMIAQFKMYPTAFVRRILGRLKNGAMDGRADIQGIAELIVSMSILNYLSIVTKDILSNRTPSDPRNRRTVMRSMLPALGIYGDFIGGEYNKYGRGLLESGAGPGLSNVGRLAAILADIRDGKDPSKALFFLGKQNTPAINLWFTKAPLQYMVGNSILERISPGSLRRARKRMLKENNQDFIFPPR